MMFSAKTFMHNFFCGDISVVRFLWSLIPTKRNTFPIYSNSSIKPATNFNDSKEPGFIVPMTPFQILKVYLTSNLSKIANSIVASITVDVVNIKSRPITR